MKNVIDDAGDEADLSNNGYLPQVFDILSKSLNNFDEYLFIIYNHNSDDLPKSINIDHPKKVLILQANESKRTILSDLSEKYHAIFSPYFPTDNICISIPVGFHKSPKQYTIATFDERLYDMFFVGNLNRQRIDLAAKLSGIPKVLLIFGMTYFKTSTLKWLNSLLRWKYPRSFLKFNPDFNAGISSNDYFYILSQSKVVFNPKGWMTPETYRFTEGLMYGCVVISESLPDRDYYNNAPFIEVSLWKNAISIAKEIVKSKHNFEQQSFNSINFYKNKLSPVATAEIIQKRLEAIDKV